MQSLPIQLDALAADIVTAHPDDPLGQLEMATSTAADLEDAADHLIGHFVDRARAAGYSWTGIGERIGVTKQAVRKRFAPPDVPEPSAESQKVFGRYTEEARGVVVAAQEAARTQRHDYIGTEHLLLALCDAPDGAAGQVLANVGKVRVADFRETLIAAMGPPSDVIPEQIPFTPKAKKALELASRQAFLLGHGWVGPEHLLLGVLSEGDGLAARALGQAGIDEAAAQAEVRRHA